jgi:hypothetical protein
MEKSYIPVKQGLSDMKTVSNAKERGNRGPQKRIKNWGKASIRYLYGTVI